MTTNDHTVPQSYLRRFAKRPRGKADQVIAARVDDLERSFPTSVRNVAAVNGFYWGTDPDGVPHHAMEELMTAIEGAAAPAFSAVLDTDWALPQRWPPAPDHRVRMSWWIAAQILRTTRQRHRLEHLREATSEASSEASFADALEPPTGRLRNYTRNNPHLAFITAHLAQLAAIVGSKPWGIGWSDSRLPTSDVPVVVMNGQDADDQLLSVAYWDILLPLDPHRFLLLPALGSQADPATWTDHRLKLDGGMGIFVTDLIWSAADTHIFWHPDHEPGGLRSGLLRGGRLPRPWDGDTLGGEPQSILQYGALPPGVTVERRWMDHSVPAPEQRPGTAVSSPG